ncbi:MAG: thioesterase family protein [Planctomycetota bacterium]
MNTVNPLPEVPRSNVTEIRVRYQETDAQGHVHHGNYVNYFEIGRVEMLRNSGVSYREFEELGLMLVVVNLKCDYLQSAKYDDLLKLTTTVVKAKGVRIKHSYKIEVEDKLIVQGETTVACVNREGKVRRLPAWLQMD